MKLKKIVISLAIIGAMAGTSFGVSAVPAGGTHHRMGHSSGMVSKAPLKSGVTTTVPKTGAGVTVPSSGTSVTTPTSTSTNPLEAPAVK